jgi:hypothetical protein
VVLTSAVAVVCVEWIADEISVSLVRMRYARAELMASVAGTTILLRRLREQSPTIPRGWNARWSDGSPGACTAWWSRGTARSRGRGDGSRGRARGWRRRGGRGEIRDRPAADRRGEARPSGPRLVGRRRERPRTSGRRRCCSAPGRRTPTSRAG